MKFSNLSPSLVLPPFLMSFFWFFFFFFFDNSQPKMLVKKSTLVLFIFGHVSTLLREENVGCTGLQGHYGQGDLGQAVHGEPCRPNFWNDVQPVQRACSLLGRRAISTTKQLRKVLYVKLICDNNIHTDPKQKENVMDIGQQYSPNHETILSVP